MSVPKSRRTESDMAFLQGAREIVLYTLRKCVGFPKRYTFYISQPIADCAIRIEEYIKRGNSIYPTNAHEVQMRRDEFIHANTELYNLLSLLEIAGELFGISADTMQGWAELIHNEIRLVGGVLKKDKARYKHMVPTDGEKPDCVE